MDIHQMQVRYDALADRLLWQVRTRTGEMYAVWLTRRMVGRLWPPYQQMVTRAGISHATPDATVLPEAREMLEQAVRERPLPSADFKTQFNPKPIAQPLGPEPLLPTAIDLTPDAQGAGLAITLREEAGRSIQLRLGADLSTALLRLLDQALRASDWGLPGGAVPAEAANPAPAPPPPSALN